MLSAQRMSNVTFAAILSHPSHLRDPHTHRMSLLSLSSNSINRKLHNSFIPSFKLSVELFHFPDVRSDIGYTQSFGDGGLFSPLPGAICMPENRFSICIWGVGGRILLEAAPKGLSRTLYKSTCNPSLFRTSAY